MNEKMENGLYKSNPKGTHQLEASVMAAILLDINATSV